MYKAMPLSFVKFTMADKQTIRMRNGYLFHEVEYSLHNGSDILTSAQVKAESKMPDLKSTVKNCKVESIHAVVENGRQKFLCFTRLCEEDNTWFVVASDGADVWRNEFDEDGLDAQRDLVNISTTDAFLIRFKNGFTSGELTVACMGTKLTITVGKGSSAMELDLFETKSADRKTELQTILFRMAEQTKVFENKLSAVNQSLEKLRAQKSSAGGFNAVMDFGTKKLGSPAKAKPKKTGMSVVNPASRKRKAATGVVFE